MEYCIIRVFSLVVCAWRIIGIWFENAESIRTPPRFMLPVVVRIVGEVVPVVDCTLEEFSLFQTLEVLIMWNNR